LECGKTTGENVLGIRDQILHGVLFSITSKRLKQTATQQGYNFCPQILPTQTLPPCGILKHVLADIVVSLAFCISITFSTIMSWVAVTRVLTNGIVGASLWDLVHILGAD
jgi:hypothetical protein